VEGIRLDQHSLEIQLPEQLPEHGPLVVRASGVAGAYLIVAEQQSVIHRGVDPRS
jgi:hypothetical protein